VPNANVVKALHDSCYVDPSRNYRVIKEDDPVKAAAINEATRRYEEMVARRKSENSGHIHQHAVNVKQENHIINREQNAKALKTTMARESLENQMASNEKMRTTQAKIEANPYKPHFGPEDIPSIVDETRASMERQKS